MSKRWVVVGLLTSLCAVESSETPAAVVSSFVEGHQYLQVNTAVPVQSAESTDWLFQRGIGWSDSIGQYSSAAANIYKGTPHNGLSDSETLISASVRTFVGGGPGSKGALYSMDGGYTFTIDTPMILDIVGYASTAIGPGDARSNAAFQYKLCPGLGGTGCAGAISIVNNVNNGFQWLDFTTTLNPGSYLFTTQTMAGTYVDPSYGNSATSAFSEAKFWMHIRGLDVAGEVLPTTQEELDAFLVQHVDAVVGPLSAVPIPTAVWLFGSGLLGLIGFARRKARSA